MIKPFLFLLVFSACGSRVQQIPDFHLKNMRLFDTLLSVSAHLKKSWRGYAIFDQSSGKFVAVPEADQKILRDYPYWVDKGPLLGGTRLTITTAKSDYTIGEHIHIGHIVEETDSTRILYIMGPKKVTDEYVNDSLKTQAAQDFRDDYPWLGLVYDGKTLQAPGIDYNFEITEYKFDQPGIYRIQWKPGKFASNTLTITVTK